MRRLATIVLSIGAVIAAIGLLSPVWAQQDDTGNYDTFESKTRPLTESEVARISASWLGDWQQKKQVFAQSHGLAGEIAAIPQATPDATLWYVDVDAAPGGDGTEGHPFQTIQQGIDAAAGGDQVIIAPGDYMAPTVVMKNNVDVVGASTDTEAITIISEQNVAVQCADGALLYDVVIVVEEGSPLEDVRGIACSDVAPEISFVEVHVNSGTGVDISNATGGWLDNSLVLAHAKPTNAILGVHATGDFQVNWNYIEAKDDLNEAVALKIANGSSRRGPLVADGNIVIGTVEVKNLASNVSGNQLINNWIINGGGVRTSSTRTGSMLVAHNTRVGSFPTYAGFYLDGVARIYLRNNIIGYVGKGIRVKNSRAVGRISYNNLWAETIDRLYVGISDQTGINGNRTGDPGFLDFNNMDYRLDGCSEMIDAGEDLVDVTADFDGNARPFDGDDSGSAQWDIGASEYVGPPCVGGATATPVGPPTSTPTATNTPTPTNTPTHTPTPNPPTNTPTPDPSPQAVVSVTGGTVQPGNDIFVPLDMENVPSPGAGAVTIDIQYDPAVIIPSSCDNDPDNLFDGELCNLEYDNDGNAPDAVRLTLISTAGVPGSERLAIIGFRAVGGDGSMSQVAPVVDEFSDPTGLAVPVTTQTDQVQVSGSAIVLGDVNCDVLVNAIDSLFVMQHDVGLRDASNSCPLAEGFLNVDRCDVNSDSFCNAVDALMILQCDAGYANMLCPAGPAAAEAIASMPDSDIEQTHTINIGSAEVDPGETVTIPVTGMISGDALGVATIEVEYDPAIIRASACEPDPGDAFDIGLCNPDYDNDGIYPDIVRFSMNSLEGVLGAITYFDISFEAVGPAGGESMLIGSASVFADTNFQPLDVLIEDGAITIVAEKNYLPLILQ